MNNDEFWGNRGENIINPKSAHISGRKSIHSHPCCPFGDAAMVRYGMEEEHAQKNETHSPSTSGRDEVDNILSKPVSPTTPVLISKSNIPRRKSWSSQNQDYTDDSIILSTSLPEKFSSHLHCSDESGTEKNDLQTSNLTHYQSFGSNQSLSQRSNSILIHECNDQERESEQPPRLILQKESSVFRDPQSKDIYFKTLPVLLVIVGALVMYCLRDSFNIMQDKNVITSADNYDRMKFYNDMSAIGKIYKIDEDSILQLQVGISSISEREDTDSFIFVYDSEKHNFNSSVFNEFINEIASVSARYLRNESASVRHIVVNTSSIKVRNTDELIHKYSDDITKGGVMVMTALEMLPSSLAMALHYYCDVYNPLVKKSAMFFTLDIANCSDKMSTHSHIEKCLKRKWSSVSNEFIGPLLARVVSVVLDVTNLF